MCGTRSYPALELRSKSSVVDSWSVSVVVSHLACVRASRLKLYHNYHDERYTPNVTDFPII